MKIDLWAGNSPASFWQLEAPADEHEWIAAMAEALPVLCLPEIGNTADLLWMTLGEGQFGHKHFTPSMVRWLYYRVKGHLPDQLMMPLRRALGNVQRHRYGLSWPLEERHARFQWLTLKSLLARRGTQPQRYRRLWPGEARYAFVLTHDVETAKGQEFVRAVADLDEAYGMRSCFNLVPERYRIDGNLVDELKRRGFEIGAHGLRHDGKLFESRRVFMERAERINRYLHEWGAVGFRAPFVMRHPEWMQALDVEYDASFFDTDPYQPIPGGTMSLWPFFLGRFVELPYTLSQDCVLASLLQERTPILWLRKVNQIARYQGMALVNTHPDYLRHPVCWRIYQQFLCSMSQRHDYWHALPRDVARWWRLRAAEDLCGPTWDTLTIEDANHALVDRPALWTARVSYRVPERGTIGERRTMLSTGNS